MSTWIKLTDEVMHEMEGDYWLATTYRTVVIGAYIWVQGRNPDRFQDERGDYYTPDEVTHVMKFTPPQHPLKDAK
jgi:hypothetical protein